MKNRYSVYKKLIIKYNRSLELIRNCEKLQQVNMVGYNLVESFRLDLKYHRLYNDSRFLQLMDNILITCEKRTQQLEFNS